MRRLQYPNKNYLIKEAIRLFPDETVFSLIGFRQFNKENSVSKKIFAIEQRLKDWKINDKKPKVLILCYLLKEATGFKVEQEVLDYLNNKYSNLKFTIEYELSN